MALRDAASNNPPAGEATSCRATAPNVSLEMGSLLKMAIKDKDLGVCFSERMSNKVPDSLIYIIYSYRKIYIYNIYSPMAGTACPAELVTHIK